MSSDTDMIIFTKKPMLEKLKQAYPNTTFKVIADYNNDLAIKVK